MLDPYSNLNLNLDPSKRLSTEIIWLRAPGSCII